MHEGALVVAATPIGNPDDASPRLVATLGSANVIAAEDTRRLRRLASSLGVRIEGVIKSYYEATEQQRVPDLVKAVAGGGTVLLVSDAGMPTISDPGYRLVAAVVAAGLPVRVLPGPSAVTAALAVSGLPTDRFCFEGFLARRASERRRQIAALKDEPRTLVIMESRHRLGATTTELAAQLGHSRPAVLCRELTKTHEEIVRGDLGEIAAWVESKGSAPVGEVTLVIAGADSSDVERDVAGTANQAELAGAVSALIATGLSRRDAVAEVAARTGVPRRRVYQASIAAALR